MFRQGIIHGCTTAMPKLKPSRYGQLLIWDQLTVLKSESIPTILNENELILVKLYKVGVTARVCFH